MRRRLVPDTSPRLLNNELVAYLNELLETALSPKATFDESGSQKHSNSQQRDGSLAIYYDAPLGTNLSTDSFSNDSDNMDLS
jgi:hypothetical protein